MPEPSVVGILGAIILVLMATVAGFVRAVMAGKLVPGARYAEAVARADRYEIIAMKALGVNEQLIPLVERQAAVVQTVEDVVGHSMKPAVTDGEA